MAISYKAGKRLFGGFIKNFDRHWLTRLLEQTFEVDTHFVSPDAINYVTNHNFERYPIGKIVDGNWDDLTMPLESHTLYQSLRSVFVNGGSWEQTVYFQNSTHAGSQFREKPEAIIERTKEIERMYQEISEFGYQENSSFDQISVGIGRRGDLLLIDGKVRLGITKILNINRVPIRIVVRHPEWIQFKREILNFALGNRNRLYAPLLHPDLERIPSKWDGQRRFEMIRRNMVSTEGSLLDIGCHWGYFCHRFEELGFDCTGIEMLPENFYFLEKIKRAGQKNFQIVNRSIVEHVKQENPEYAVILALAVFHHLIKTKENLEELKKILSLLRAREMFFLPHDPQDEWMLNAYWNPEEEDFVNFMVEHSNFSKAERIGSAGHGRSIYRLS